MDTAANVPEASPAMPRWASVLFRIWAGVALLSVLPLALSAAHLSRQLLITDPDLGVSMAVSLFGSFPFVMAWFLFLALTPSLLVIAILSIAAYGAFRLRGWVLPVMCISALLYAIGFIEVILRYPLSIPRTILALLFAGFFIIPACLAYVCRDTLMGPKRRISVQAPFAVLVTPLLILSLLSIIFPDLPEVHDADLVPEQTVLPSDEVNAYFPLQRTDEHIHTLTKDDIDHISAYTAGDAWNQAHVDSLLDANGFIIETMRHAATLPQYQCPAIEAYGTERDAACNPVLSNMRRGAQLASLSALSRARKGDISGAFEDALVPVNIGQRMMEQRKTSLIEYLVGVALQNIGLSSLQTLATTHEVPSDILLSTASELSQPPKHSTRNAKNVVRHEYLWMKEAAAFIRSYPTNFYMQPNRLFSDIADGFRKQIVYIDAPCHELTRTDSSCNMFPRITAWKLPFTRNAVWKPFGTMFTEAFSGFPNNRCEAEMRTEEIRLQLVLQAYRYDHGTYPASQSELVPQYIATPIINPLTGSAFAFTPETGEIVTE